MRIVMIAVAALAVLSGSTGASAQTKYYSRERIVGMPKGATMSSASGAIECGTWRDNSGLYVAVNTASVKLGDTTTRAGAKTLCEKSGKTTAGHCVFNGESAYWVTNPGQAYTYSFATAMTFTTCTYSG